MEFIFQTGPCDRSELVPQLAQALELRTEAVSRKKLPKLWKKTDQLNENQSEDLQKHRKRKSKILGILFLIVGVVLAVPGILANTGLNTSLIGGIMACIVGITYLMPQTQGPSRRMTSLGQKLLNMRSTGPAGRISFTEAGMSVNGSAPLSFEKIENVVETQDLFLLIISNGGMFLLKDECLEGDAEAFAAFLNEQLGEKFIPAQ